MKDEDYFIDLISKHVWGTTDKGEMLMGITDLRVLAKRLAKEFNEAREPLLLSGKAVLDEITKKKIKEINNIFKYAESFKNEKGETFLDGLRAKLSEPIGE